MTDMIQQPNESHKQQPREQTREGGGGPTDLSSFLKEMASINWQRYLFFPHMFANLTTIIVCFLFYGIYILLDEYLHTILISILVGTSLKPIKNAFVTKLLLIMYRKQGGDKMFEPLLTKLKKNFLFNTQQTKQHEDYQGQNSNVFSQIKESYILRDKKKIAPKQRLTIKQTIFKIIWQIIVVTFLVFIFYLIQDTPGLVILFFMLVGEYLIGVWYAIFRPVVKLSLWILFRILQVFYDQSRLKKILSKFLSVLFIVLVIALIILTITFSIFLIYKDIMNIKEGINEDFVKKNFLNYSTHFQTFVDFATKLNVTQQLKILMPEQKFNYQYQQMHLSCQRKLNQTTLLNLTPEPLKYHLCNLYTKYDYQTFQKYLPIMKQLLVAVGSIIGLSFSSVYGLYNFIFLAWFKIIMFLSTTYYITEDFNLGSVENLLGRFISVTRSRTDKISELFLQIKNIMFGSVKICFLHFMLSWIMFDYFNITNFNFILSLFLGFMALVPIYHPFIGAFLVFFGSWLYKNQSSSITLLLLSILYFALSNKIFSLSYSRLSMPNLITNMSVILGIYSFGILGVVYGPIIVTILQEILNQFKKF